jgi:hypothetical protein
LAAVQVLTTGDVDSRVQVMSAETIYREALERIARGDVATSYEYDATPTEREIALTALENGKRAKLEKPDDALAISPAAADEIRATWRTARDAAGQSESFRILERMVDRLGYGRTKDNPSLAATEEEPLITVVGRDGRLVEKKS